jgi:pilus assembly protein CpaB
LENLEVLAAGQNVQRNVDGQPQTVQDVTLLLTPEQAQKVALATGEGRIQLALRNPIDKESAEPPLSVKAALYGSPTMEPEPDPVVRKAPAPVKRAPVVKPVAAVPETRVVVVEVIQGAKRSTQSFEEEEAEIP